MNKDFTVKEISKKPLNITKEPNYNKDKLKESLESLLNEINLFDGMTISFHHHLRNGDYILNMVMEKIYEKGIKDITIYSSSIFPCHKPLVPMIKDGTIKKIYAAYINGEVAEAISYGYLKEPCVMHTHGGRARILQDREVKIDYAFIAAPNADKEGNISGKKGPSACGSIGYAVSDAHYSKCSIAITDYLTDNVDDIDIEGKHIDHVIVVDKIGDSNKIVSGTTQITKNPVGLKIAKLTKSVIEHSGYLKDGFSFQTGAGGISLAVADYLKTMMIDKNIKGSFASGGITGYLVDMHEAGLFEKLYDVQCFDLKAIESINKNKHHYAISASKYANVYDEAVIDNLDVVVLGATEVDTDFNVNVTTGSNGIIMGGSGGHSDTAYGAKMTIIVTQLMNARISSIKDKVTTVTTPGETVDVVVTERGIAVNPKRTDLIELFNKAKLNLVSIEDLKDYAERLTNKPKPIGFDDKIVGIVEYRDGQVIDYIYKKRKINNVEDLND